MLKIRDLLGAVGIKTLLDFQRRTGLSKQRAWQVWHGKGGLGREKATIVAAQTGIPVGLLLSVEPKRKK